MATGEEWCIRERKTKKSRMCPSKAEQQQRVSGTSTPRATQSIGDLIDSIPIWIGYSCMYTSYTRFVARDASFSFRRDPSSFPASHNFQTRLEQPLHRWSLAWRGEERREENWVSAIFARIYSGRYFALPARNRRACIVYVHRTKRRSALRRPTTDRSRYLFSNVILVLRTLPALQWYRQYRTCNREFL